MMRISLPRRDGVTLSEILISMLVMSVGVVSLATLFPISILRSIQATQLTNATIHRLNGEELIGLFPRLIHDPNANAILAEHELQIPLGGLDNPDNTVDGVDEGRFIVDPLGANDTQLAAVAGFFGNDNGAAPTNPIARYNGGFTNATFITASNIDYLADSWQLSSKANATASTTSSVTAPAGADLTAATDAIASGVRVRIVLFSQNGKQSVVREHTTANPLTFAGQTISWTDPAPWAAISRFRLEIFDPRYSWLLTVRKTPGTTLGQGTANIDVVVYHKRPFSVPAEQVFAVDSWNLFTCTLDLTATNALATKPKPFLKKGGFLFDAQHARWYRITDLKKEDTVNPVITLDRPVFGPINPATGATVPPTRVMAMPGIVDVYPIGSIPYDSNNPP